MKKTIDNHTHAYVFDKNSEGEIDLYCYICGLLKSTIEHSTFQSMQNKSNLGKPMTKQEEKLRREFRDSFVFMDDYFVCNKNYFHLFFESFLELTFFISQLIFPSSFLFLGSHIDSPPFNSNHLS